MVSHIQYRRAWVETSLKINTLWETMLLFAPMAERYANLVILGRKRGVSSLLTCVGDASFLWRLPLDSSEMLVSTSEAAQGHWVYYSGTPLILDVTREQNRNERCHRDCVFLLATYYAIVRTLLNFKFRYFVVLANLLKNVRITSPMFFSLNIELILKQHRFELLRTSYTWIFFFSTNTHTVL